MFEDLLVRGRGALESQDPREAVVLLDRALGLWRGEVLGDLADFGFVAPVAGRLQELRLSAMELRMEAELALGHHGTAVAELDRLVAEHPLRERLHAEHILALYRSGRQSDALAAYRQLRRTSDQRRSRRRFRIRAVRWRWISAAATCPTGAWCTSPAHVQA